MPFVRRPWHRRGVGRGARRGQGYSHGGFAANHIKDPGLPAPGNSQKQIESIVSAAEHAIKDNDEARIRNVEYVASYNWKEGHKPAILVPGKPPKWQPPSEVQDLPPDGGIYYRDPNSARYPSFPTEPAIRAILIQNPEIVASEIGVFGCGNTIGSLLSFTRNEDRTFRFGVELIGLSLFLVRKTNSIRETIEQVKGYGHTFPEAYTSWERDVKGSCSHQRIIKYDFAGLKCFVRTESDGYLPDIVGLEEHAVLDVEEKTSHELEDDPLSSFIIGVGAGSENQQLVVDEAGQTIPQQAIFDLKTRSKKNEKFGSVDDFLHRLWVNQTPNFILAFHTWGKFEKSDIHIVDVTEKTKKWETDNIHVLSKLAGLLHKLINVAETDGRLKFEVRRTGTGPLELWTERADWSALPDDLKALWPGQAEDKQSSADIKGKAKEESDPYDDYGDDDDDDDDRNDSGSDDGADYLQFKAGYVWHPTE